MTSIENFLYKEENPYFSATKKEKKQLKVGKRVSLALTGIFGVGVLISYSNGNDLTGVFGLGSICSAYVSVLLGCNEYGIKHPNKYDAKGNLKQNYFSKEKQENNL